MLASLSRWILEEARLTRVRRDFDRWPRADNSRAENANVCAYVYVCEYVRVWEREEERRRGSGTMRSVRPSFTDEPLDLAIDQTLRCKLSSFFLPIWAKFRGDISSVFRGKKWNLRANQATVSIRHAAGYESSGNRNATLSYETSVWVSTVARGNNVGCCWWLNVWTTSKGFFFLFFFLFFVVKNLRILLEIDLMRKEKKTVSNLHRLVTFCRIVKSILLVRHSFNVFSKCRSILEHGKKKSDRFNRENKKSSFSWKKKKKRKINMSNRSEI